MTDKVSRYLDGKEDQIFSQIPVRFRGLYFERLFRAGNSQESTRKLELASILLWMEKNTDQRLLFYSMMTADSSNERRGAIAQTDREWEVAELTVATFIQWVFTQQGTAFVQEVFQRAGGSLKYTLPPET